MPKTKNVSITPEEHAIVRRLKAVHDQAHKTEKSGQLDDWAFVYGFLIAGLTPKRAHEFALLDYGSNWFEDPIFAADLP